MEQEQHTPMVDSDSKQYKYTLTIYRDIEMMKTFLSFSTRVKHPRVSFNMFLTGALLVAFPIIEKGLPLPARVISYVMGALLVLMALFRQYISLYMLKANPEVIENEKLTYLFSNNDIKVENDGEMEYLGYYKNVYRIWEDEKNYFIGMNEDDLIILPKSLFHGEEGQKFLEFILEKTGADYVWKPANPFNIFKNFISNFQMKIRNIQDETDKMNEEKKDKK